MKGSGQFRGNWFCGLGIVPTLLTGFRLLLSSVTHKCILFLTIVIYWLMHIWVISILLTLIFQLVVSQIDQRRKPTIISKPSIVVYADLFFYCPRAVTPYCVNKLVVYISWRFSTSAPSWFRLEAAHKSASNFRLMLLRTVKDIGTVRSRTSGWMRRFCTLGPICSFNSIERKHRSADQYNLILCCFHNVFFKVSDIKLVHQNTLFLIN